MWLNHVSSSYPQYVLVLDGFEELMHKTLQTRLQVSLKHILISLVSYMDTLSSIRMLHMAIAQKGRTSSSTQEYF